MPRGPGIIQRKILLLLLGGLTLGLSRSPSRYFRIIGAVGQEWRALNRAALWRSIRDLYRSKMVRVEQNSDGSLTLVLTGKGRKRALVYDIDKMKVKKPAVWDRKWRVVTFDIPEKKKSLRDSLRLRLRQIGFLEFQKSIFICPYPCDDEVDFLIEFHDARHYVRKILAEDLDNELHMRTRFNLA